MNMKKEVEYFKVLGKGLKTRDDFQWAPGKWNKEPRAEVTTEACGIGLHVWKNKPDWGVISYLPDHTYRVVGVDGLCGEDDKKARFRRVKLSLLPMTLEEILGPERDGFKGADLSRADLSDANLSRADLSDANLSRADLSDANLSGADLSDANLSRADLSRADLSDADLSGADLSRANLSDADLSDADLSRANLSDADLSGADLSNAHGCKDNPALSDEQRSAAHC